MIRSIRNEISSWYMQLILILLVLSFVTFYGWSGSGLGTGNVASVDGEKLSAQDFRFQYQNRLQYFQSQGIDITDEQQGLVQNMILSNFVNERIRYIQAQKAGFVTSTDQVRDNIQKAFADSEGNFNFDFYKNFVRNRMGKNPSIFEKEEGKRILAQTYQEWIVGTSLATPLALEYDYRRNNDKRSISFVAISLDSAGNKLNIDQDVPAAEIQTYYEQNSDQFTTEQKRQFEILRIAKADMKELAQEDDFYAQARKVLSLVKDEPNLAYETYAQNEALVTYQKTDWVSYADAVDGIASEDLAMIINSSLSLEAEGQTDILQSRDGASAYLVKVHGIKVPVKKELEEVRADIVDTLLAQKKTDALQTYAQNLLTTLQEGKQSFSTITKKQGLKLQTTESFAFSDSGTVPMIGNNMEMEIDLFAPTRQEKQFLKQAYQVNDTYYIAQIDTVEKPEMDTFATKKQELWTLASRDSAYNKLSTLTEHAREQAEIFQVPLESL